MLSNQAITQILYNIADAMEVLGENRFRLAAYRRAGDTLAGLSTSLADAHQRGGLTELAGIGEGIAAIISELLETGASSFYDALMTRVPPGLLEILQVPEIGPKSAARLYHEIGITSLEQLREAASAGKLRAVKGFGAKTEARILAGIEALQQHTLRIRLVDALPVAHEIVASLINATSPEHISTAGSLRRGQSTVRNLDIVVASANQAAVLDGLLQLPHVAEVLAQGEDSATIKLHNGYQLDLAVTAPERWGSGLQYVTGSADHNGQLQELARSKGLEYSRGGFRRPDGSEILCASEEQVYATLDLPWIPPELRHGWDEVTLAQEGQLPELIEQRTIQADLHWHTAWSDGRSTLREMAEAGRLLGYRYMSVADHSAYLGVTGGLDDRRLQEQRQEIDQINAEYAARNIDFCLLQGCEVDILADGSLALPDEVLARLDLVIASPHVALRQERAASTARLIRAIEHPHVDVIGHPTGRLLNQRAGADLDMDAVLDAAAARGVALEVNAGPERLDLDAPYVRQALRRGIKISINTDAHDPRHLAGIDLGVLTARRGGATAGDVINTFSREQLLEWLASKSS